MALTDSSIEVEENPIHFLMGYNTIIQGRLRSLSNYLMSEEGIPYRIFRHSNLEKDVWRGSHLAPVEEEAIVLC